MSKKLIAVASAAALALTALVAVPASATTISAVKVTTYQSGLSGGTADVNHTSSTDAVTAQTFAASRLVQFDQTGTTTRTAVRFDVTTSAAATVTVSSTGGVKLSATLVDGAGAAIKVTDGTQSLAGTTVTGVLTYAFYAWNTSTTAGTVVVETAT